MKTDQVLVELDRKLAIHHMIFLQPLMLYVVFLGFFTVGKTHLLKTGIVHHAQLLLGSFQLNGTKGKQRTLMQRPK